MPESATRSTGSTLESHTMATMPPWVCRARTAAGFSLERMPASTCEMPKKSAKRRATG